MFMADKIVGCAVSRRILFSKEHMLADVSFKIDLSRCYQQVKIELEYSQKLEVYFLPLEFSITFYLPLKRNGEV